jgi:creatinine amidohydrolase
MRLLELTTHEFARSRPELCFWPVGTVEAHDQGPLGTDVLAPQQLVEELAPRFGALILPTLPFGLVSSLAGYPGGMWLAEETYRRMIHELLASLTVSGVRAVVIFNGHGGNTDALAAALPPLWKEHRLRCAALDWWTVAGDLSAACFGSAGGHGGADELAIVRAGHPQLAPERWTGERAYFQRPGVRAIPAPRSAIRYTDEPARPLTPESGAAYYAAVVERLAVVIGEILAGWAQLGVAEARGGAAASRGARPKTGRPAPRGGRRGRAGG